MPPRPPCPASTRQWWMRASGLLLRWQLRLGTYSVCFPPPPLWVMLPSEIAKIPHRPACERVSCCLETSPPSQLPLQVESLSLTLLSLFLSLISCPTSFGREWAAFLGAWCPLPALRSCFVEVAQRSNDLLMNLWERKWSPRPIPWPSWDCLHYSFIINSSGYFNIFCFSCDFQKYYYGRLRCNFLSFCLNWNFNLDQCFSLVLESSKLFCFLILLLSHFLCFSLWYSSYELLDHFTISHLSTVFFLYFSILLYNQSTYFSGLSFCL